MKPILALLFCCVLALGLAACGDDDGAGFEGIYEVTHHTLNDTSCDAEGPDATDPDAYFKLQMGEIFGFPVLEYYSCTSTTECEENPELNKRFSKLQGEWRIKTRVSSEMGSECHLSEVIGLIEQTKAGVKIEQRTSQATVTPSGGEECHPDLVDTYSDQMVCEEYEVIEGRSLQI